MSRKCQQITFRFYARCKVKGIIKPINYFLRVTDINAAVRMAMNDIKNNSSILESVDFSEISSNDGCNVDKVLQTASLYSYQPDHKLGFLGPWCSETVESIRGRPSTFEHATSIADSDGFVLVWREKIESA